MGNLHVHAEGYKEEENGTYDSGKTCMVHIIVQVQRRLGLGASKSAGPGTLSKCLHEE